MPVDVHAVRAAAQDLGFQETTLEKVVRLGQVLEQVSRHPLLKTVLALKGGTALNLMRSAPERLSVDLDFNYVGAEQRESMLKQRPEVESALERIVSSLGYRIQRSADEHAGRKLYLSYQNLSGVRDRIEIDLNYLYRIPLLSPETVDLWQPRPFAPIPAVIVASKELAAGKIRALLDRSAPRDIWDVARLPSLLGVETDDQVFRAIFLAMTGTLSHPVYTYGRDRIERVTPDDFAAHLHPMLTRQRPDRNRLIEHCWGVVMPLLKLNAPEQEFVDRLQDGYLEPEGLPGIDKELIDKIRRHPALLWKVQNVKRAT